MAVNTIFQVVQVTDVNAVTYSPIEFDTDTGEYVREVRVFAPYAAESKKQVFSLQVRSQTREGIEMTTPSLSI